MRRIKLPCEPWRPHRPSSPAQLITSPGVDAPLKIMASSLINPGVFIKASVINNHFGMRFLNLGLLCACPSRRRWWPPAASHPVPPWPCTPQIPQHLWGLSLPHPEHMGDHLFHVFVHFGKGEQGRKRKLILKPCVLQMSCLLEKAWAYLPLPFAAFMRLPLAVAVQSWFSSPPAAGCPHKILF